MVSEKKNTQIKQIIDDKFEIRPQEKNPGESSTFPLTSAGSCWIDREKEVEQGEKQGTYTPVRFPKQGTPWSGSPTYFLEHLC